MSAAAPLAELRRLTDRGWVVGGAVRDELLGRPVTDLDVAVDGDARGLARALGRATGAHSFQLSDAFGAWRVSAPDRAWQVDLTPLTGPDLGADLANRDLTVNAIARPLGGDGLVDPFGGVRDLGARRLTMVSDRAFQSDPLRVVRLARLAVELDFSIDAATLEAARAAAAALTDVAGERIFAELRQILAGPRPGAGLAALEAVGATAVVLPELLALRGVQQSQYHHKDVLGHTLEAVDHAVALVADPVAVTASAAAAPLGPLLAEPVADELDRGQALVWAALLHDIAKPQTRAESGDGRVSFYGHDVQGAAVVREILGRLRASERLTARVAEMTRHHLRLGFLVHDRPLEPRTVWAYLTTCDPVSVDVTLLSVAARLATRGRHGERAIAAHLALVDEILATAIAHEAAPVRAPIRGDVLARALERAPGPWLTGALAELAAARFAGEIDDSTAAAVAHARAWLGR